MIRTTTTETGTDPADLTFDADEDGAAILVRSATTNDFTIGAGAGSIILNRDVLVAHHGAGDLTIGRPVTGDGGMTKSGTGNLVLSQNNSYSGDTTLLAGTITLDPGSTLGASSSDLFVWDGVVNLGETTQIKQTIRLYDGAITNGTLTFNSRFHYHRGTLDATLTGNGGLDKWESSTLTLDRDNTYAGTTAVRGGTLLVNNPGSGSGTGAGNVTVHGATLGGNGRIGGDLRINTNGKFAFSITDTLNVDGAVTFEGFEIDDMQGLDENTPVGVYRQIEGGVIDVTNLSNLGSGSAQELGENLWAYFQIRDNSLEVVVTDIRPTLAVISGVRARVEDGVAVISWDVALEIGTVGYYLERLVDGGWQRVSSALILSDPFLSTPHFYEQADPGAPLGTTQTYRIVELDVDGRLLEYGPYELLLDGGEISYAAWAEGIDWGDADSSPDADPDGDGLTNWQEYLAGTDPLSANSVLRVTRMEAVPEGIQLTWPSVAGRVYAIEMAQQLTEPFIAVVTGIEATPPENAHTLPVEAGAARGAFFRVVVE